MYDIASSPVLRELGTDQVRQVLRASPSVATFAMKYPRVVETFHISFHKKRCATPLINSEGSLYSVLTSQKKPWGVVDLRIAKPTTSKALLLLHIFCVIQDLICTEKDCTW